MRTTGPKIKRRTSAATVGATLLVTTLVLTSCGGPSGGESAEVAARKAAAPADSSPQAASDSAGEPRRDGSGTASVPADTSRVSARVVPAVRDIIYRGAVTVRVKNVQNAAERAEQITLGAGGEVFAEQSTGGRRDGDSRAHLTVRVPPREFRKVLADLGDLGVRLRQSQTAEDVTTEVVDTQSRLASQRRSVARVRALLDQAKTIAQVVQVESELSRREADLESLQAQMARLKDMTQLATIEVDLVATAAPGSKPKDEEIGFLAGFRGGWHALVQVVLVTLTVAGALVPFAVTALLLGIPLWLLVRSRLRRRTLAPVDPASA